MVFKRRNRRNAFQRMQDFFYPPGGWGRAFSYVGYRLRRLPDPPHRIARGIASGVFVSFTPFFGFHFVISAAIALTIRGNLVAAMLATLVGNPLTFPFIAAASISTGEWILGVDTTVPLSEIFGAFSMAFGELWHNLVSLVTDEVAHWDRLQTFFYGVFLPYLVGGILPGLVAGIAAYILSQPLIEAYQQRRSRLLREKLQAKLKADRAATTD